MSSPDNASDRRRNPVRRSAVATPWRLVNNKQRRLELMSVAPRDQLNEDERRQLDNSRSRQARKKSQAVDDSRGPSSGYHTPPSTHPRVPRTSSAIHPDLDDAQVANARDNHDGDIKGIPLKSSSAGQPQCFLGEVTPSAGMERTDATTRLPWETASASASQPRNSEDEQKYHISGIIDEARAAEQGIGGIVTGHGGSRLPSASPHQRPLVTPNASARDQEQSTSRRFHHPSAAPSSPPVVRMGRKSDELDQGRPLRLTIGPVTVEAQLQILSSGPDGGAPAEELREVDEAASHGKDVPVLVVDPGSVLFCTGIVTFLWVVWWLWSM